MDRVGKRGKDIKWDDDWILSNYWQYTTANEVCDNYNSAHSTNIGKDVFRHHCQKKLGLTKSYTKEQYQWLSENYPRLGAVKCTEEFNAKFSQSRSVGAIQTQCKRNGIKCDSITKRLIYKDNFGVKSLPIGSTRKHHGYTYIKVSDELGHHTNNWIMLHHKIYEDNFGKVPEEHIVIFLDNNKENFSPDNLVAIPWKTNGLMNGNCLKSEDPEITKAGLMWCELHDILKKEGELT